MGDEERHSLQTVASVCGQRTFVQWDNRVWSVDAWNPGGSFSLQLPSCSVGGSHSDWLVYIQTACFHWWGGRVKDFVAETERENSTTLCLVLQGFFVFFFLIPWHLLVKCVINWTVQRRIHLCRATQTANAMMSDLGLWRIVRKVSGKPQHAPWHEVQTVYTLLWCRWCWNWLKRHSYKSESWNKSPPTVEIKPGRTCKSPPLFPCSLTETCGGLFIGTFVLFYVVYDSEATSRKRTGRVESAQGMLGEQRQCVRTQSRGQVSKAGHRRDKCLFAGIWNE